MSYENALLGVIAGGKSRTSDPFIGNVLLLLHGEGSNGSTTITDSSAAARTSTAVGDAQISTAQFKFGAASIAFDGTGDSVTYPQSTDFDWGTGDLTIEMFIRFNALPAEAVAWDLFGKNGSNLSTQRSFRFIIIQTSGSYRWGLRFSQTGSETETEAQFVDNVSAPTTNVWYHIAVCRASGSTRFFRDGVQIDSTSANLSGISPFVVSQPVRLGGLNAGGTIVNVPNAYMDEVRVTSAARYTAAFTPPTAPFPDP